jgi:RNA polymerase sigma factor (TIGR02999 family)
MTNTAKQEITVLLKSLKQGDKKSKDEIMKILYQELHDFAGNILKKENQTITFQATELVNEAYIRMFDSKQLDWNDRNHFLFSSIVAMRWILLDHAKKKHRAKRIPKKAQDSFDEILNITISKEIDMIRLDEALIDLEKLDSRQLKIVELRFFAGLNEAEIAKILDISVSTVQREWQAAKLWLSFQLKN